MPTSSKWTPHVLALLRIITALLFLEHATMKFFQFPAPIPGVTYPLPAIMLVAGTIEMVTAGLVTLGLFTRIASFIASGEMAAAYFMAHAPHGFWPALNMGEPAVLFCFIYFYLAFAGGGAWALDNIVRPTSKRSAIPEAA
jgi:putative oxidoreductase